MPFRLSLQWLCGNPCTWAQDVRLHITGTKNQTRREPSKEHNISRHKWSLTHRMSKFHRSKMGIIYTDVITCDYLCYASCLACWALFGSLVPAMCNRSSCEQMYELPQSHCGDNREGTSFSWLHIYYAHLDSVRFEHSVCCRSLVTTYIMLLAWLVEHSLVHWHQQCVTVHHVPKCMIAYIYIYRLLTT